MSVNLLQERFSKVYFGKSLLDLSDLEKNEIISFGDSDISDWLSRGDKIKIYRSSYKSIVPSAPLCFHSILSKMHKHSIRGAFTPKHKLGGDGFVHVWVFTLNDLIQVSNKELFSLGKLNNGKLYEEKWIKLKTQCLSIQSS